MSSTETPRWIFDDLGGGMAEGPNAGPTVEFRGNPSYYLAREAIQNIMDAHDENTSKPAEATFSVTEVPAQDLPGAQHLSEVFSSCSNYLKKKSSFDTASEYDKSAQRIKSNSIIKVLQVSDRNTVGMTSENWFRFAESIGFSNKTSGSGGSFGLGKGAYYASSGFYTIFISSVSKETPYIFAGKSIVTTFEDKGKRKQNNGTFGLEGQKPLLERGSVPDKLLSHFSEVFRRKENGTDFLIPDFIGENNWESELTKSILRYFWLPIVTDRLIVKIQNGESINSTTVERLLHMHFANQPFEWTNAEPPNPLPMYYAYRRAIPIEKQLKFLGSVRLYILTAEGYPNRIALVRKPGMVVDCVKKNSMNRYSGVFVCDNESGNSLLREMENQEHNEWKWENAKTKENQTKARLAYAELESFIKEELQKISISSEERYLTLEGLEDFISVDIDEGAGSQNADENNSLREYGDETSASQMGNLDLRSKRKVLNIKDRVDSSLKVVYKPLGGRRGHKRRGKEKQNFKPLPGIKFLSFAESVASGGFSHRIQVSGTPLERVDVLQILAGGDDAAEHLKLKSVTEKGKTEKLKILDNEVRGMVLDKRGEREIAVTFVEPGKYSLKLRAFQLVKKR